jgi:DNA-directed RNA polymerase subunit RPC12/RpoP
MKCDICGKKVEETFLRKPLGTYVKDAKGKKHIVCRNCQIALGNEKKTLIEKF